VTKLADLDAVLVTAIIVPIPSDETVVTVDAKDVVAGSVTPRLLFDSVSHERAPCGLTLQLSGARYARPLE